MKIVKKITLALIVFMAGVISMWVYSAVKTSLWNVELASRLEPYYIDLNDDFGASKNLRKTIAKFKLIWAKDKPSSIEVLDAMVNDDSKKAIVMFLYQGNYVYLIVDDEGSTLNRTTARRAAW